MVATKLCRVCIFPSRLQLATSLAEARVVLLQQQLLLFLLLLRKKICIDFDFLVAHATKCPAATMCGSNATLPAVGTVASCRHVSPWPTVYATKVSSHRCMLSSAQHSTPCPCPCPCPCCLTRLSTPATVHSSATRGGTTSSCPVHICTLTSTAAVAAGASSSASARVSASASALYYCLGPLPSGLRHHRQGINAIGLRSTLAKLIRETCRNLQIAAGSAAVDSAATATATVTAMPGPRAACNPFWTGKFVYH